MEEDEAGPAIPEWVVTFGDMMSLLLTFFIMLVSMSEVKEQEKFQALVESFRQQFGHENAPNLAPGEYTPRNAEMAALAMMGRAKRANHLNGGDRVRAPVGDNPQVRSMRMGKQSVSGGTVYFEPGSAELTDAHRRDLTIVATQVSGKPQRVAVFGHTSAGPLPPDSGYQDHTDLAYARARAVADFLASAGVERERLRPSSSAQYEPKVRAPDPELQLQNDRVEVVILSEIAAPTSP